VEPTTTPATHERDEVHHLLDRPHHDGSPLYVPGGVPALGDTVVVRVRVPVGESVTGVHVRVLRDGEPAYVEAALEAETAVERWYSAEVLVHNPVTRYRFVLQDGDTYRWLNGTGVHDRDVTDAADFRLSVHGGAPAWERDGVVYQIFPDRFARSGAERETPAWAFPAEWDDEVLVDTKDPRTPLQFYGGDLPGIEQRLDYLDDLGVGTVYLTPVFPGESNHRYNATTFDEVDPLLGGDEALASLSRALHSRGMHLIGDFTTNHTGDTHEWFQRALADRSCLEATYYYWREEAPGYVGWYDVPTLPKLNYGGAGLMEKMALGDDSVTARWLKEPVALDGWRIDVANMTGRYAADDFAHEVARAMRATMARINPDAALIAEHNFDAAADLVGDGWQGTMNYAGFMRPVWSWLVNPETEVPGFLGMPNRIPRRSGRSVAATMQEVAAAVSWPIVLSQWNSLDTHDTPRLRTVTDDPRIDAVATTLLFTYPGTPMMFAGLELGTRGLSGEHGRVPMPWDRPEEFESETFTTVRTLIHLRNDVRALREGGLRWVIVHDDALAYLRETDEERVLVVVARAPWPGSVLPASLLADGAVPENLFGGGRLEVTERGLEVPGDGPTAQVWRLA
jgi:alpha-glucosidase